MLRLLLIASFLLASSSLFARNFNVPIRFINDTSPETAKFSSLIQDRLLKNAAIEYDRVSVKKVMRGTDSELTIHLLAKETWTFETVKMVVNKTGIVTRLDRNLRLSDLVIRPITLCPDASVQVVYATPCDWIPTAVNGVEEACADAEAAGFKCKTLIGNQATLSNYQRYLRYCPNLKAFGNIGHGNTSGILLANDEVLSNTWFSSLPNTTLNNKVVYFNSCQVHNAPLEPSIINAGSKTFIGGNINLLIGPSEEVFKCFWQKVVQPNVAMGTSLSSCESSNYPSTGAHGVSGSTGVFRLGLIPIHPIHPIGPITPIRPIPPIRPIGTGN